MSSSRPTRLRSTARASMSTCTCGNTKRGVRSSCRPISPRAFGNCCSDDAAIATTTSSDRPLTALDRRRFLQLLAAAAVSPKGRATEGLRVVVAGAGIVGASIAYHLAKSGANVTVIDRQGPATNASRASFAWINATWSKQPRSYHALNQKGVARWKELQAELNLSVRWGGSLEGNAEPGAREGDHRPGCRAGRVGRDDSDCRGFRSGGA